MVNRKKWGQKLYFKFWGPDFQIERRVFHSNFRESGQIIAVRTIFLARKWKIETTNWSVQKLARPLCFDWGFRAILVKGWISIGDFWGKIKKHQYEHGWKEWNDAEDSEHCQQK